MPDPLTMDISEDLELIDSEMTHVISNPEATRQFKADPNAVLVRLGLHPPIRAAHERREAQDESRLEELLKLVEGLSDEEPTALLGNLERLAKGQAANG